MDYSLKLNKELPDDIRVLAWCTVPADFSARYFLVCVPCKITERCFYLLRLLQNMRPEKGLSNALCMENLAPTSHFSIYTAFRRLLSCVFLDAPHEQHACGSLVCIVGFCALLHIASCQLDVCLHGRFTKDSVEEHSYLQINDCDDLHMLFSADSVQHTGNTHTISPSTVSWTLQPCVRQPVTLSASMTSGTSAKWT